MLSFLIMSVKQEYKSMKLHTCYARIPFTDREVFAEVPSLTRGPTFFHVATHGTAPDLASPGTLLGWVGNLHVVLSKRSATAV